MEKLKQGDLMNRLKMNRQDEIGLMSGAIDHFIETLIHMLSQISGATNNISYNSTEISAAMEAQEAITKTQTNSVTKITATVEELSASSPKAQSPQ